MCHQTQLTVKPSSICHLSVLQSLDSSAVHVSSAGSIRLRSRRHRETCWINSYKCQFKKATFKTPKPRDFTCEKQRNVKTMEASIPMPLSESNRPGSSSVRFTSSATHHVPRFMSFKISRYRPGGGYGPMLVEGKPPSSAEHRCAILLQCSFTTNPSPKPLRPPMGLGF